MKGLYCGPEECTSWTHRKICCVSQKRLKAGDGDPFGSQSSSVQHNKRPRLRGLTPEASAGFASLPEGAQQPAGNKAQQEGEPPDPSLGGIVIQSGGRVSFHKAARGNTESLSWARPDHNSTQRPGHDLPSCRLAEATGQAPLNARRHNEDGLMQAKAWGEELSGRGSPSQGSQAADGSQRKLALAWRVRLQGCVDASPVILLQPKVQGRGTAPRCARLICNSEEVSYSQLISARVSVSTESQCSPVWEFFS